MVVKYTALGIIIDDIVFPDGERQLGFLGGGGAQTAWGMALAAEHPQEVGIISGVGQDFDPAWLQPLTAMGIDVNGVVKTDLPTPRAWQILGPNGERDHVWQVDQDTSDRQTHPNADAILQCYPDVQLVIWGMHPECPYLDPCTPLRQQGITVALEPFKAVDAPRSDEALREILSSCDIYSPNAAELFSEFGTMGKREVLDRAKQLGGKIFAIRKGEQGAEAWNLQDGSGAAVPSLPVNTVVDPVGAGDAFLGAFSVAWLRTESLYESVVIGSVAASYMLDQIGMPTRPPSQEDILRRITVLRNKCTLHHIDDLT